MAKARGGEIIKKSSCFRRFFHILLIIGFFSTLVACHHRQDEGIAVPEGRIAFDRIAVLPFQQIVPEELHGGSVSCPLCGVIFNAMRTAGTPEAMVEKRFLEQLEKRKPKFRVIAGDRVAGMYKRVSSESLKAPLRQILRNVGSELGAEGIVIGYLYRFRERKGASFSVEQPASVALEIHLLRVEDGVLVWRAAFDRTQSSLMEDLLQIGSFYREKARWVTAEELADEGLEKILESFPGLP
ncbi:MAG: hypothetical protein PHP66_02290 [Syntrophales bacterium]|nr:hypothetical protein [Syntrophales bacterium]